MPTPGLLELLAMRRMQQGGKWKLPDYTKDIMNPFYGSSAFGDMEQYIEIPEAELLTVPKGDF